MSKMRKISPFISVILIALVLSGSQGFTFIKHNCSSCGTSEILAAGAESEACCVSSEMSAALNESEACCGTSEAPAANAPEEASCCSHDSEKPSHRHSEDELVYSDDCCTNETERLITAELIRTEVQPEVMPYFMAAVIIAVIAEQPAGTNRIYTENPIRHYGRDLATFHCQIIS